MRERRKRTPRCNAADRGWDIIPTRKRADFRMVIRCETRYRTCRMRKGQRMSRQMGGASKEAKCASSAEPRAWTRDELDRARKWVGKLQRRIAKAQREKKYNKVKALQHLLGTCQRRQHILHLVRRSVGHRDRQCRCRPARGCCFRHPRQESGRQPCPFKQGYLHHQRKEIYCQIIKEKTS